VDGMTLFGKACAQPAVRVKTAVAGHTTGTEADGKEIGKIPVRCCGRGTVATMGARLVPGHVLVPKVEKVLSFPL